MRHSSAMEDLNVALTRLIYNLGATEAEQGGIR
jgi:hypothetical protein